MKAPSFAYAKPKSLAEAFELIERPGAKILTGGQSLVPTLNMRLSAPELLVDITGLPGLSEIVSAKGLSASAPWSRMPGSKETPTSGNKG